MAKLSNWAPFVFSDWRNQIPVLIKTTLKNIGKQIDVPWKLGHYDANFFKPSHYGANFLVAALQVVLTTS